MIQRMATAWITVLALAATAAPLRADEVPGVPASVAANSFSVIRPLGYYANRLGVEFLRELEGLRGDSHWIDGGSGEGVAIEQYHQLGSNPEAARFGGDEAAQIMERIGRTIPEQRARTTGISFHMSRPGRRDYGGRLRFLTGRLMEDIPGADIGCADLISDVYGVFAYSNRLDIAMAKYLAALKPGGNLYIFDPQLDRTSLANDVSVLDWLGRIRGMRLERTPGGLKITRTPETVSIPRLKLVSEDAQNPPVRIFRELDERLSIESAGSESGFSSSRLDPGVAASPLPADVIRAMNTLLGYEVMRD